MMPTIAIDTPQALAAALTSLFPSFANEVDTENAGSSSYHAVWLDFSSVSHELLSSASKQSLKSFCVIINTLVDAGGHSESAVSTCFLEHASQIGVRRILLPHLSVLAKRQLR